jgi:hypothetical protein
MGRTSQEGGTDPLAFEGTAALQDVQIIVPIQEIKIDLINIGSMPPFQPISLYPPVTKSY